MAVVERDQRGRQHAGDEAGGGPHGEPAPGHAREGPGLGAGRLDVGQDTLEEGQERAAVGGEGDQALSRAAVEEEDAELLLEQADLARQRGLGQVQPGRGLGEALLLGHGQDVGQLVQLHDSELNALNFMLFMSLTCGRCRRMVAASPRLRLRKSGLE